MARNSMEYKSVDREKCNHQKSSRFLCEFISWERETLKEEPPKNILGLQTIDFYFTDSYL